MTVCVRQLETSITFMKALVLKHLGSSTTSALPTQLSAIVRQGKGDHIHWERHSTAVQVLPKIRSNWDHKACMCTGFPVSHAWKLKFKVLEAGKEKIRIGTSVSVSENVCRLRSGGFKAESLVGHITRRASSHSSPSPTFSFPPSSPLPSSPLPSLLCPSFLSVPSPPFPSPLSPPFPL